MVIRVTGENENKTPAAPEGDPLEEWTPPAGITPSTESKPSGGGYEYTDSRIVPPSEPASVWMPDYDRRYQGVPSRTADAGGGYIVNPNSPMGNRFFNNLSQAEALSEWDKPTGYLTLALKEQLDQISKEIGNSSSTGKGLWTRAIANSYNASKEGRRMSPFESVQNIVNNYYSDPDNAEDEKNGGGRGRYTGPVTSTTLMNKADLKSTANAVASSVLGRGITDEEFEKVLKQVRTAERSDPTVSTSGIGSNVTQQGLTAEGRQDIIRESLMKGPEAEDYSKATTMMNIFNQALESRPEGA